MLHNWLSIVGFPFCLSFLVACDETLRFCNAWEITERKLRAEFGDRLEMLESLDFDWLTAVGYGFNSQQEFEFPIMWKMFLISWTHELARLKFRLVARKIQKDSQQFFFPLLYFFPSVFVWKFKDSRYVQIGFDYMCYFTSNLGSSILTLKNSPLYLP